MAKTKRTSIGRFQWSLLRIPFISTLSKIIEAMGGELQIVANMPNGKVQIRQLTKIRKGQLDSVPTKRRAGGR